MKQIVLDLNAFVRDLAGSLSSVMCMERAPRSALSQQELAVMLDPVVMGESLMAFLSSRWRDSIRDGLIALGTQFLPIDHTNGDNGDGAGCALLYVSLTLSTRRNRIGADDAEKVWANSPVFRIIRQSGGSARVFQRQPNEEQMNIYLPVLGGNRFFPWHLADRFKVGLGRTHGKSAR